MTNKDLAQAIGLINMLRMELKSKFAEREDVVDCMLVSLVNRSHFLMIGPPGTAKTAIVSAVAGACTNVRYFEKQMTNFTEPQHVWGPMNVKKYMDSGIQECLIDGMLPEAEIAMLDEAGRGSKSIMDELLVLLSDRRYKHGSKLIDVPLMSCFGASNTFFEAGQEALYDRFLLRAMVGWITSPKEKRKIRRSRKKPSIGTRITREQLLLLQKTVDAVVIPDSVEDIVDEIIVKLKQEGVERSDRRWQWLMNAVAANALLAGRMEARPTDLAIMSHGLWEKEEEIKTVKKVIVSACNPDLMEAEKVYDQVVEDWEDVLSKEGGISAVNIARLSNFKKTIQAKAKALNGEADGVEKILKKMRSLFQTILKEERLRAAKNHAILDF